MAPLCGLSISLLLIYLHVPGVNSVESAKTTISWDPTRARPSPWQRDLELNTKNVLVVHRDSSWAEPPPSFMLKSFKVKIGRYALASIRWRRNMCAAHVERIGADRNARLATCLDGVFLMLYLQVARRESRRDRLNLMYLPNNNELWAFCVQKRRGKGMRFWLVGYFSVWICDSPGHAFNVATRFCAVRRIESRCGGEETDKRTHPQEEMHNIVLI